jgi:hypothetical protein
MRSKQRNLELGRTTKRDVAGDGVKSILWYFKI